MALEFLNRKYIFTIVNDKEQPVNIIGNVVDIDVVKSQCRNDDGLVDEVFFKEFLFCDESTGEMFTATKEALVCDVTNLDEQSANNKLKFFNKKLKSLKQKIEESKTPELITPYDYNLYYGKCVDMGYNHKESSKLLINFIKNTI